MGQGMTIEIQLTKGYTAIVDDCDGDLAEFNWCAFQRKDVANVYAMRTVYIDGKKSTQLMHRVILSRMLERELVRSELVDHERGIGLNNCRSNIRLATCKQNMRNRNKTSNGTSLYKGITFLRKSKKKGNTWVVFIGTDTTQLYLGTFHDPLEAHRAYCIAALKHHSPFHNFGANSPFLGWTLKDFERGFKQLPLPFLEAA